MSRNMSSNPIADSKVVASEYLTALAELNSSKPQITFLTMLADESKDHAEEIVKSIEEYANTCTQLQKLPCLYLVDSIIKNVKGNYVRLFQLRIHHLFAHIFEKVDEKTRRKMYELRQTWNEVFRKSTLYGLDVKVQALDPAWPVTAPTPSAVPSDQQAQPRSKPSTIFLNPTMLKNRVLTGTSEVGVLSKELELLELQKQKLALEKKQALSQEKPKFEVPKPAVRAAIVPNSSESSAVHKISGKTDYLHRIDSRFSSDNSSGGSRLDKPISRSDLVKGGYKIRKRDILASGSTSSPATADYGKSSTFSVAATAAVTATPAAPPPVPVALQFPPSALAAARVSSTQDKTGHPTNIHIDPRHSTALPLPPSRQKSPGSVCVTPPAPESSSAPTSVLQSSGSAPPFRDPRKQANILSQSRGAASAKPGSRDPRIKVPLSRHRSKDETSLNATSHQQGKSPSREAAASNRIRSSSSSKHRSRERFDDKDDLFKPDVMTKIPAKIKIDINMDAAKCKAPVENRDPRTKSRDLRIMKNESKSDLPEITGPNLNSETVTTAAPPVVSTAQTPIKLAVFSTKEQRSPLFAKEKSLSATNGGSAAVERHSDRREEIKRELRKVDKLEAKKTRKQSSHAHIREDRTSSSRDSQKYRDRKHVSKPKENEKKLVGHTETPVVTSVSSVTSSVSALPEGSHDKLPVTSPAHDVTSAPSAMPSSTTSESTGVKAAAVVTATSSPPTSSLSGSNMPSVVSPSLSPVAAIDAHNQAVLHDSFRSIDRSSSRKRNFRKRTTPSPEPMALGGDTKDDKLGDGSEKNIESKNEDTDSDESDHYEGNKPNTAKYTEKKGDVDLRLFSSDPKHISKMTCVDELFGLEDVDLRTLSGKPPPGGAEAAATTELPAAFQASSTAATASAVMGDQDLRGGISHPSTAQQSSKSSSSEQLQQPMPLDPGRQSINSPLCEVVEVVSVGHPTNWDKFREKNPEFKEYQRQCSTPALTDGSSHLTTDPAQIRANIRRRVYGDDEADEKEDEDKKNLQVIVHQAEEQLQQGQITIAEYNHTLQEVVSMVEREKMHRARERDRSSSVDRGDTRYVPHRHDDEGSEAEPMCPPSLSEDDKRMPLPPPPLPPHIRMLPPPLDEKMRPLPPPPRPTFGRGVFGAGRGGRGVGLAPTYFGHDEWTGEPDLPFVPEEIVRQVLRESETRTIDIDGSPREIRTYGTTAVLLMDAFDPRIVSFEDGYCNVVFDEGKFVIPMHTTDDYKEFQIEGETHRVKLGVPTQELFLDGRGYQCFFGGKPITIHLAGKPRTIRLDGKPPSVAIGKEPNTDYLLGKISLVVNANTKRMTPLYLDAKPQRVMIDGKVLVIKFVNAFQAVNINTVHFPVNFGGLPMSISVRQLRKYLSFSSLPPSVIPGQTTVLGMESTALIPLYPEKCRSKTLPKPPAIPPGPIPSGFMKPPPRPPNLPMFPPPPRFPPPSLHTTLPDVNVTPNTGLVPPFPSLTKSSSDDSPAVSAPMDSLDSSEITVISARVVTLGNAAPDISVIPGSYLTKQGDLPAPPRSVTPKPAAPLTLTTPSPSSIDVSSLLQTLIKVGIIGKPETNSSITSTDSSTSQKLQRNSGMPAIKIKSVEELKAAPVPAVIDENDVDWIDKEEGTEYKASSVGKMDFLFKSQQLRRRSGPLVSALYRGMQCSSCGMRYPPEQTVQYSHHLDWHFRQNKREQESTKKASSRKFYIPIDDWMQYEEIEDIDDRVPSMFEGENGLASDLNDGSMLPREGEQEESVCVNSEVPGLGVCPVCHDTFSQFFQHETDEWHYRNAIARDGANYHPCCYQDLVRQKEREVEEKKKLEENAEEDKNKTECEDCDKPAVADGSSAVAEENSAEVEGSSAVADGNSAAAEGNPAVAEGSSAIAEGSSAIAEGSSTGIEESSKGAEGNSTGAEGSSKGAEGNSTGAEGSSTGAEGSSVAEESSTGADGSSAAAESGSAGAEGGTVPCDATTAPAAAVNGDIGDTVTPPAADSPIEPEKKKKKKKKKKRVEPIFSAVRIKEEPKDDEDISVMTPKTMMTVDGVQVKLEPLSEPNVEEPLLADEGIEEMEQSAAEDDIGLMLDTTGEVSSATATASNLVVSSIDGNVEQSAAPDAPPTAVTGPKIRISGALGGLLAKAAAAAKEKDKVASECVVEVLPGPIPVIGGEVVVGEHADKDSSTHDGGKENIDDADESNKLSDKIEDGAVTEEVTKDIENGLPEDEGVEALESDDDDIIEWDEFIPPPFSPDFAHHPRFKDEVIKDEGITRAGIEMSGLCCLM